MSLLLLLGESYSFHGTVTIGDALLYATAVSDSELAPSGGALVSDAVLRAATLTDAVVSDSTVTEMALATASAADE